MNHKAAFIAVGLVSAWLAFLAFVMPAWVRFCFNLADGEYWGLALALSPMLVLVYALIGISFRKKSS